MPRRTSSRLRGGAAAVALGGGAGGGGAGASDGETSSGSSSRCPPPPPSPGKRKTRSPIEDENGLAGLANPNPVRCAAFQSPKKRVQGVGDRFSAPFDKENDTSSVFAPPLLGDGASGEAGALVFRLSAFSAFSQRGSTKAGESRVRARRSREETAKATTPFLSPGDAPSTPRVSAVGSEAAKGAMLPFLLAPASVTSSPDLRRKPTSRRAQRSRNSSSSSSSSGSGCGSGLGRSQDSGSPPPPLIPPLPTAPPAAAAAAVDTSLSWPDPRLASTPRKGRRSVLSGAGCAAGRRRAATAATSVLTAATVAASAPSASAASPTQGKDTGGGGPAGSYMRVVGGGRLGPGGGGGGATSDHSPHRSPGLDNIHRLTESLQKWDPGSRYTSPGDENIGEGGDVGAGAAGGAAGAAGGAGEVGMKEVGSSWNGQELRRTLEKERMGRGRQRRHSITSAQDTYPQGTQGRFGDHSPISPASSAGSINLGGFDACTPVSAGRPWRSSPRRAEAGTSSGGSGRRGGGGCSGVGDDEGAGSAEHFGIERMEGSWSEDETGPSGTAMKLAFSPRGKRTDAQTPTKRTGGSLTPPVKLAAGGAEAGAGAGARAGEAASAPSLARWQFPFSPVKGQGARGGGGGGSSSACFSVVQSPADLSRSGDSAATETNLPVSPERHSLQCSRDLMDQGTDDDDEGGGRNDEDRGALVRRRRHRPRPELALRTLEMPDAMDTIMGESGSASAAGAAAKFRGVAANGSAGKSMQNPFVSPAFTGKRLDGEGAGFGSGCATACRQWDGPAPLEGSSICTHDTPGTEAEEPWVREGGKGKGRDWGACSTSSGFGIGAGEDRQQDVSGVGVSEENTSGVTLGLSSMSGLADTSCASEASTSFVKSRPIPDQSAFSSRISKVGSSGAHSPAGSSSGGGGGGGGPATGPAPVCLTPRKSMMRCPPTPQRTPTWDGLEDSLLLEGAGSGGRACGGGGAAADLSSRSCLRQSKLLASKSDAGGGESGGGVGVGGSAGNAANDAGLSNVSCPEGAGRRSSPRFEPLPVDGLAASGGGGNERQNHDDGGFWEASRTEGRGGRGRGGRERLSAAGTNEGGGRRSLAEQSASASGGGGGGGGGEDGNSSTAGAGAADSTLGFKHDFVQMGPIGEGGFSVVWKVRAKGTGKLYAIKRSKREFRGRRDRDRCLLEARALQRLGEHPGVLRFERAWQEEGHFCLQTELCELGTLKDFLERLPSRREIPEAAVWQVLHDVGQALRHVHAMGLVHLDVKPANLLIGDEGGRLKLADFGMATAYGDGVEGIGDGQEGDTLYMAKELLSSTARLPSADMFSLGLTVYEVATRMELPGDGEYWHAMRDGTAVGLPSSRSQELGALLRQLKHPDPRQRPTADALCEHPRVANITGSNSNSAGDKSAAAAGGATAGHGRDDFVVSQARAWRAAEVAAMDYPSSGLRTPTGDMTARYIFYQTG
ncbi:unnamed protein product [Pylaiella littoralis]